MEISRADEQAFQESTNVHICGEALFTDRVRDHCHLTESIAGRLTVTVI